MSIDLNDFSLVPEGYKDKDPRMLAYLYPQSILRNEGTLVAYNKKVSKFIHCSGLEIAETTAKKLGFILLPATCIHWRRAASLGEQRRIKVGKNNFYMVKENELTEKERIKLVDHIAEFKEAAR